MNELDKSRREEKIFCTEFSLVNIGAIVHLHHHRTKNSFFFSLFSKILMFPTFTPGSGKYQIPQTTPDQNLTKKLEKSN